MRKINQRTISKISNCSSELLGKITEEEALAMIAKVYDFRIGYDWHCNSTIRDSIVTCEIPFTTGGFSKKTSTYSNTVGNYKTTTTKTTYSSSPTKTHYRYLTFNLKKVRKILYNPNGTVMLLFEKDSNPSRASLFVPLNLKEGGSTCYTLASFLRLSKVWHKGQ